MRPRLLFVLCAYLAVWVPFNAAALASASLPSLDGRGGAALLELAIHLLSAALCAGAGWMLWQRNPAGVWLAAVALCINAVITVQALHVSALPRDVAPGLAGPLTAVVILFTFGWIVYPRRSRRLRAWLE